MSSSVIDGPMPGGAGTGRSGGEAAAGDSDSVNVTAAERTPVAVTMPDMDESEARIIAWCVGAGDEVEEGEPICVVSVDGHHAEVLSASAGRVAELLVGVDARVFAGASLAELEPLAPEPAEPEPSTNGHEPAWAAEVRAQINDLRVAIELEPEPAPDPADEPEPVATPAWVAELRPMISELRAEVELEPETEPEVAPEVEALPEPTPEPAPVDVAASASEAVPRSAPAPVDLVGFHSPAVRRLAAEHGIDLAGVVGTGRDGRIRKEDVLASATSA